jgi:predicted O-methyltransferase YrrM
MDGRIFTDTPEIEGNGRSKGEIANATAASGLLRMVPDFEKIDGWLGLHSAELLFTAAAAVRVGCIVEVGSYRGRSTTALCAGSAAGSKAPVYAIEPHEQFIGVKGGVFGANDRRSFFRTMLTTKFTGIVRLINTTSEVITPGWDKPVSLLFIDGDHRYEAVLSDFLSWRPHLINGALVIFQDSHGPGPQQVIKDNIAAGYLTLLRNSGSLTLLRFNPILHAIEAPTDKKQPTADTLPVALAEFPHPAPMPYASKHLLYSQRGQYLYQALPGCAWHAVLAVLLELEGMPPEQTAGAAETDWHAYLPRLDSLPAETADAVCEGVGESFNFVFVRDPYTRMATVFRNTVVKGYQTGHYFWIERVIRAAALCGITLSERITFAEYIQVISAQSLEGMDTHWRPQYYEGRFAEIKFNFIGHVEKLSNDLAYVLERLDAPNEIMHKAVQPRAVREAAFQLWATVPGDIRAAFLRTHDVDFDMLRYPKRPSSVLFTPVMQERVELSPATDLLKGAVNEPQGQAAKIVKTSKTMEGTA